MLLQLVQLLCDVIQAMLQKEGWLFQSFHLKELQSTCQSLPLASLHSVHLYSDSSDSREREKEKGRRRSNGDKAIKCTRANRWDNGKNSGGSKRKYHNVSNLNAEKS